MTCSRGKSADRQKNTMKTGGSPSGKDDRPPSFDHKLGIEAVIKIAMTGIHSTEGTPKWRRANWEKTAHLCILKRNIVLTAQKGRQRKLSFKEGPASAITFFAEKRSTHLTKKVTESGKAEVQKNQPQATASRIKGILKKSIKKPTSEKKHVQFSRPSEIQREREILPVNSTPLHTSHFQLRELCGCGSSLSPVWLKVDLSHSRQNGLCVP